MTDEEFVAATEKIQRLCDTISKLVDEKADMAALIKTIGAEKDQLVLEYKACLGSNARLATELRACIAEKGELQKQLALKSGMGIHENRPETFKCICTFGRPNPACQAPVHGGHLQSPTL
jgi:hypothetical protein